MPTQNTDSSAIAVSTIDVAARERSRRIAGISLGATLITVLVLFAAMALTPTDASATTYNLTSTAPITNWSDISKWNGGTGTTYPGQSAGDTAVIGLNGFTMNVDVNVPNPVSVQISGTSIPIQIPSGSALTLDNSSTATSTDTFTVLTGGTMGTASGASISAFQGNVTVSGGTFNSAGSIQFNSGNFIFNGGSLTGSGSISANAAQFTGSAAAMSINATTFNDFSSLSYSGSTNTLTLSGGATINVFSGASFNLQNDLGINGTSAESIHILSGGSLSKTAGATFSIIAATVKNDGTVTTSAAPSGGSIGLSGPGTHSGAFTTGSSNNFIAFGGANSFNSGTSFSGSSLIEFKGGTQTFNASVTANSGIKWMGGTIDGTGPLVIPNTASMIFDGSVSGMTLNGALHSAAAMTYAPTNPLTIDNAGFFVVTGSLSIAGDYDILTNALPYPGTLKYGPGGTVTKTAGASGSTIYAQLDSGFPGGTLANNASGPLNIAADANNPGAIAGPIAPAAGSVIRFTAGEVDTSGTFSGGGTVEVAGGTLKINAATTFSGSPSLNISSGTLSGSGAITLTGTSTWTGGTITGTNSFTINAPGTMNLTGATGTMTLDGRTITNNSTLTLNAPAANHFSMKNSAVVSNTSLFDIKADDTIDSDLSANLRIDNVGGTFQKSAGTGTANVYPQFNHSSLGLVLVSGGSGTLDFHGGGTSSAQYAPGLGATIGFDSPGTYTLNSGTTFGGTGTLLVAGTFDLDTAASVPAAVTFQQNGGVVTGNGNLSVAGPYTWTGGTTDSSGGTGVTNINGTLTISGTAQKTHNQRTINNNGTTTWTGGNISSGFSATFNNTGTFNIQSDKSYFFNLSGSQSNFNNSGTVTKTVTTGTTTFGINYNQSAGATTISTGTFYFNNGFGSYTGGTVSAASGATLNFGSGDPHTLDVGSTVNGAGTIGFQAGVTYVNGAYNVTGNTNIFGGTARFEAASSTTNQLTLSSGTLAGAGTLTVTGPSTWSGFGSMSGSGGTTTFQSGSSLAITGTSAKTHIFRTINNAGTITWTGGDINTGLGAIFNNTGTFNIQTNNSFAFNQGGTLSVFNNSGSVTKSVQSGMTTVNSTYNQTTGSTTVSTGLLVLTNGGSYVGSLALTNTANKLIVTGGTLTMNTGTSVTGNGYLSVDGAGAQITLAAPLTVPRIALLNGTIGGANLTIANDLLWQGGTLLGPGTTTMSGGSTVDHTTPALPTSLDGRTFNNAGTFNYTPGTNFLTLTNGAVFNNNFGGSFNILGDSQIGNGAGANSFTNAGVVTKSAGASGTVFNVPVTNSNAIGVTVANGTIIFANGGSMSAGGITAGVANSNVHFFGGTFTISGGALSGSSGTIAVLGSGLLNIANSTTSTANFSVQTGGTVDVAGGKVFALDNLTWTGGTIQGSGQTRVTVSGSIGNTSPTTLAGGNLLTVECPFNYDADATNYLTLSGTSQLAVTSIGTMSLRADGILAGAATASVSNQGTLTKTLGSGASRIDAPFTSTAGTVGATSGTLHLKSGGGSLGNTTIATGTASKVQFEGNYNVNAGTTVSGTGTIVLTSGLLSVTPNLVVPTLIVNGGTLTGTGNVTINGTSPLSEWTGGTISGSGTLTVGSTSNFIIDGITGTMILDGRPLVNNGTVTYGAAANSLTMMNGAVLTNASGAILNLDATPALSSGAGVNAISNAGTLQRGQIGSEGIGPSVANTGTINANAGQLAFNGGLSQSAGSMNLLGGSIYSPATISLAGGKLTGNGTVFAAVNNSAGIVAPGSPTAAGIITLNGPYSQGASGAMNLKIGGPGPGGTYDVVDASAGSVSLAGNLNVTLFNGFTPSAGNTFDMLRFSSRTGDFITPYNTPTFAGGGNFQSAFVSGSPNVLRLTAVVTSSDLSIAQTAPPSLLHGQNGTWTLTVTNGPTPVTNVSVTDTFANASFVSATSVGACTPSGSTVTCAIGSLAANQSVNVSLILNASSLVTIANGASVTATEFDPNTANNNTGNANTTVLPAADLSIANTASGNPVNAGSPLSFVLNVSNAGPDATSGTITVTNTVPSGVTGATGAGTGWTCGAQSGSTITCTSTTSIPSSSAATPLAISMTAPANGPAVDTAAVSATTGDPNTGNNSASASVTITPSADLSVVKTGPASIIAGQSIAYNVVVTNNGPSSAATVTVADPTPAGLTFVSNSGGCATAYPCNLGTMASGQVITITSTYTVSPGATGSITNTASVSSTTTDTVPSNNSNSTTATVNASADLLITKSGPASSTAGSTLIYTITVTNNGSSDAGSVTVTDATPASTTFVSNTGACTTAFPCALGTLTAGQSKTITSSFTVSPAFTGTSISNTANVTSTTSDPLLPNNSATATTSFGANADLSVTKSGPASAASGSSVSYTITITNNGPDAALNVTLTDPTPLGLSFTSATGACPGGFPCGIGTLASGQSASTTATYTVTATSGSVTNTAQVSSAIADTNNTNDSSSATTTITPGSCGQQPPNLIAPAAGATVSSPVTFSWTTVTGATSYKLFASIDGASTQEIGSTTSTSLTLPIASGSVVWSVQAIGVPNCSNLNSATRTINVCSLDAPVVAVVGTNTSGQTYTVQWTALPGVTTYELQEALNAAFDNATTFNVTGTSKTFTKSATLPTAFFYRVRALGGCNQNGGPFSASERVVIVPVPPINTQDNSATVDINNKKIVVLNVFIPGQGPATPYSATTDEPWLTVSPATGILLPQGITLQVSADPADLPNGTFTATVIVTLGSAGKVGTLDTKPAVSVPVSISVVTPVSPSTLSTPPANALIIPSVGHLDGINSQWRSDVRITNTAAQRINYLLRFTPAGGDTTQIKQTQISIAAGDTTALDDIVKNWYGVGALGDAANGVLEVRPLNTSGKGAPNAEDVNVSLVTVASSRTFNQSAGGTLGQYIPAIPFANFIGKVSGDARAGILSMQQIAQSAAYRTNLGIVEASGKPASVLVSVFDAAGKNLLDLPIDLKAGEQQQLNAFLASKNITLADGRIEVKVTGGEGKIIAYASVVDNKTTDPLLVTGTPLAQTPARTWVLPGVADITSSFANWRTDLRVFNAGADPQYVTMTLYPQTGSASSDPISRSVSINPGEITILDNILASRFGLTNFGGALHVDTLADTNLVVTGRTYNQIEGGGTYGQFIGAITPADAVGKGGRTLNVLQVEDSTRYRTNLGIAEVSGKPATVEVSVLLPDAKVAPKLQIPLAANEYRQFRVLQQLGVGTAYNARITIRVIDGDGRITAYGSVVDMQTQDPTYVPAQ